MGRAIKVVAALLVGVLAFGGTALGAERKPAPMNIRILENSEFDADHGVSSGKGTKADPYVFTNLQINSLHIENTSKYIEIKKTYIAGTLLLDWIGDRAKVHYNRVGELVVNRNVRRTGAPTSGSIVHNTFNNVQQLRHWDGLFAHNTVGLKDKLNQRSANFDGFNGARYEHNVFYGWVDARLHGHHHSSSFDGDSHMHDGAHRGLDHSQRYHAVSLTQNVIKSEGDYALAYLDTGHGGNDRTAPSEQDKALNEPHAHHTKVRVASNRLEGAGILVDVFNAEDRQKHTRTYMGMLEIAGNKISLRKDDFWSAKQLMGIEMRNARDVHTHIEGNSITGWATSGPLKFLEQWDTNAGILLQNVDKADVMILDNYVANRVYGIRALNFTVTVNWFIGGLRTKNVDERVSYENVPRKPKAA
jgi:hypothetical protein